MASKYTLTYFDGRGRAEVIRLTFVAAGVKFTDRRITFEQWGAEKAKAPQGALPYLEVDGSTFSQSLAILRFLAREFSMYGKSNVESFHVDELLETTADLFRKGVEAFFASEDKKKELIDKLYAEHVPKYLGLLEKSACGKGGFIACDTLTVADIYIFSVVENFKLTEAVENFPKLKACVAKVASLENIKNYLKTRPVTAM